MREVMNIFALGEKVLRGGSITRAEASKLANTAEENLPFLLAMADKIRQKFVGDEVDLCSIVNGRSGRCSEDCTFCAQSAHYKADIKVYDLLSSDELVAAAKKAQAGGALRFSIVTSGRGVASDNDFPKIIEALKRIKAETNLLLCASLGTLTLERAKALKEIGVSRYHHNVESSRGYYDKICSTHSYDDRAKTIEIAHQAGLEVCSGGIMGLGESMEDRLDMAFDLKEMNVHSVPLNLLNPIKGTPLEGQVALKPKEILKIFALFRFILPKKGIRTAGGREVNLRDLQALGLMGGINGMLIGGYLTTGGRNYSDDMKMITDLDLVALSAQKN
ncbi:MAG: biotin synthase BioB [Negativicutes bacterium]|nr:biotin synthase BioB [Negativicutes bacterium]MBP8629762.1 biotin synthase BioB [Negativicutes bacterium]MBP9537789.1 biotin synthase BioB [Negativicutes bacterium]MBP9949944.1 biotin synthase BioB [Negativicutes bacterium]